MYGLRHGYVLEGVAESHILTLGTQGAGREPRSKKGYTGAAAVVSELQVPVASACGSSLLLHEHGAHEHSAHLSPFFCCYF